MDIKGTGLATKQAAEREWIAGQGWTSIDVWEGPTLASVEGLVANGATAGYTRLRIFQMEPGRWRLEATAQKEQSGGVDDPPVDDWELDGEPETKGILQHPHFRDLTASEKKQADDALDQNQAMPAGLSALAQDYYSALYFQHDSYFTEKYVLKHTRTIGTFLGLEISMAGILQVWDSNTIVKVGMPDAMTTAVEAVEGTVEAVSESDKFRWGWLKMPTKVRQNFFSKVEVVETWIFDLWNRGLYPDA